MQKSKKLNNKYYLGCRRLRTSTIILYKTRKNSSFFYNFLYKLLKRVDLYGESVGAFQFDINGKICYNRQCASKKGAKKCSIGELLRKIY